MQRIFQLDLYTLHTTNFCIALVFTIALAISLRKIYTCPGYSNWFKAMLFSTIGLFLLLMIDVLPAQIVWAGCNGLLILAYIYLWLGFREFTHTNSSNDQFILAIAPSITLLIFLLSINGTSIIFCTQLVTLVQAVLAFLSARLAIKNIRSFETGRLLCAITLFTLIFLFVIRSVILQQNTLNEAVKGSVVVMLLWTISLLGLGTSILLISTQWLQQRLLMMASYDVLTGVYNRNALADLTETIELTSKLSSKPWCIAMIDIDHFKKVNDSFGHIHGDEVLKNIANKIAQSIRRKDILVRFGGEEFIVILLDTSICEAEIWAERARELIAQQPVKIERQNVKVTISIGLASDFSSMNSVDVAIKNADTALYAAKNNGRNQVSIFIDTLTY